MKRWEPCDFTESKWADTSRIQAVLLCGSDLAGLSPCIALNTSYIYSPTPNVS